LAATVQIVATVGSVTSLLDLNDNPAGILVQRGGSGVSGGLNLAGIDVADVAMPVWTQAGGASTPEATTRTITVPVHLLGASLDAVGAKVQSLAKLVGQPWVLRVRRSGATVDGWIRCYPTIPQISTDVTGAHGGGVASGVITAQTEPYAYGARVDRTAATVPLVDPTATGAFVLDVTGVTGDAPTPVFIRCSDAALVGTAHGTLFCIRRTGTPTSLPVSSLVVQAESGTTSSTNVGNSNIVTTASFADATFSGGTGARWTFVAGYTVGDGAGRSTFTPALSGAEAPGLYKLLARVRRSTGDEYTFNPYVAGTTYALDAVVFPAGGTNTRMVDLGTVQLPSGQPQQLAAPTPALLGAGALSFTIDMFRTSGTASSNLDVDYFLLVPADEDLGVAYQSAAAPAGSWLTVDGYAQDIYLSNGDPFLSASNVLSSALRLDYVGGVPRLYPGLTNRLFVVGGFSTVTVAALAASAALQVSFWPRYTWLP
jgi:hypothetical protein